jgi:lipopolysaccharide heptosyltransferase I
MAEQPQKILIIKPSAMGDIVHSLPVLSAVHKTYPDAEIFWLVRTEFAGLLEGHPHLSKIILFDRKYLGTAWKNPKAFGALVVLIMRLKKEKFDLIIDLQGLFRTASLGWLSGCKVRVGPSSGREFSHFLYTKTIRQDRDSIHVVDYYLKIAAAAGVVVDAAEFILPTDNRSEKAVASILDELGAGEKGYAILIPGSAHSDKCWPSERFAAVADKIAERFGLSVIAVGTASESSLADDINGKAKVNVKNLAGRTDVPVLISLLRKAKVVISNDTGPGHIAAALKVPMVMIFGRSNPARVAPYGRGECVAAIEPFSRGNSINNFEAKYDIQHITVDEVFDKVCAQLHYMF